MTELSWLPLAGALIVIATAFILLISPNWRASLATLAMQYMGVFILLSIDSPFQLAFAKLVTGIMAVAVLGMTISSMVRFEEASDNASNPFLNETLDSYSTSHNSREQPFLSRQGFRLLTGLLAAMVGFSIAPQLATWIPGISIEQAWGSIILLGSGFLQLGFTVKPFRTTLGLLTFLSGFEIIYAIAEPSALVTGLLAVVTLGLSLAGAYFLMIVSLRESE